MLMHSYNEKSKRDKLLDSVSTVKFKNLFNFIDSLGLIT